MKNVSKRTRINCLKTDFTKVYLIKSFPGENSRTLSGGVHNPQTPNAVKPRSATVFSYE